MSVELTKILIVGYPKSGNTWLTRLCAQILDCPVEGYWQSDHDEIAVEGKQRESRYRCYKSHHVWSELQGFQEQPDHIIYICRDPRDVYLSGMHYFYDLDPLKQENKTLLSRLINRFYKELIGNSRMSEKMFNALVNGDSRVHNVTSTSWFNHLKPFRENSEVLFLRYEDLLEQPLEEAQKLVRHFEVEKTDQELQDQSIFNHSTPRVSDTKSLTIKNVTIS